MALDGLFVADGREGTRTPHPDRPREPPLLEPRAVKGIMDGGGRGVFDGTIVVRKDAQKTDAAQTTRTCFCPGTRSCTARRRLEILADDVKCKHGSTTGQLDEAALFYLRSRGPLEGRPHAACSCTRSRATSWGVSAGPRAPRGVEAELRDAASPGRPRRRWHERRKRRCGRVPATTWRRSVGTSRSWRRPCTDIPLVYLDNAASAQKPRAVIEAERSPLQATSTRTSTAACTSSPCSSTDAYEKARTTAQRFLNARRRAGR